MWPATVCACVCAAGFVTLAFVQPPPATCRCGAGVVHRCCAGASGASCAAAAAAYERTGCGSDTHAGCVMTRDQTPPGTTRGSGPTQPWCDVVGREIWCGGCILFERSGTGNVRVAPRGDMCVPCSFRRGCSCNSGWFMDSTSRCMVQLARVARRCVAVHLRRCHAGPVV